MLQNMEYIQSLKEMKNTIISNINIRNGVLNDSVEKMLTDGIVIDIGWKGNVHLQIFYRGSYMNQTKWMEFLYAITEEMSIAPPYDYKTLFEDSREKPCFGTAYDRESFNYYDFKSIEWVKIKPCFEEHVYQGRLMEDKIIHHNIEAEFLALMEKYNIPYEYDSIKEVYIIYGYK